MYFQKPMFECGKDGTKGSTQAVLPFISQPFGATRDAPEPSYMICTLQVCGGSLVVARNSEVVAPPLSLSLFPSLFNGSLKRSSSSSFLAPPASLVSQNFPSKIEHTTQWSVDR